MITSILAAIALAGASTAQPVYLLCNGYTTGATPAYAAHQISIVGTRAWIDGQPYESTVTEGGAFYVLRGPAGEGHRPQSPQMEFKINRVLGTYSVVNEEGKEVESWSVAMPGSGCAIAPRVF